MARKRRIAWTGVLVMLMAGGGLKGMPVEQGAHRAAHDAGGLRFERVADAVLEGDKSAAAIDGTKVMVDNFSFMPATASVPVGTTVTWTNHDDIPHNVVNPERKFKSPVLDTDEVFSHTFDVAGSADILLFDSSTDDRTGRGPVSVWRRVVTCCGGAAIVMIFLLTYRLAAAQPVHEVEIVASRYAFEPAIVQLTAGESVRLSVRSKEGTHGFAIPKLKIDLHLPDSGEPATVEFTAPAAGEYEIACSEFCGRGHGQMKAVLVSVSAVRTGY